MATNDGGPAFPQITELGDLAATSPGMSVRVWLAGQALAGLMANPNHTLRFSPEEDATYCLRVAEAMLAAMEAPQ